MDCASSISGFGQTGPLAKIAGHDLVIQGMTGLMGRALEQINPPPVPGFQAADFAGALMAVIGVFAAVAQRAKTGVGCDIDLSMFDALLNMGTIPLSSRRMSNAPGSRSSQSTLPTRPAVRAERIGSFVDYHRRVLENATQRSLDAVDWQAGVRLGIADYAVRRLPMYFMAHRFRPQPFLERVTRTWLRLAQAFELGAC